MDDGSDEEGNGGYQTGADKARKQIYRNYHIETRRRRERGHV